MVDTVDTGTGVMGTARGAGGVPARRRIIITGVPEGVHGVSEAGEAGVHTRAIPPRELELHQVRKAVFTLFKEIQRAKSRWP